MPALGTAATLRAQLRRRVGHGSDTSLVDDNLLDDALADALREVNKHWPIVGVGSFLTVADQQVYTPLPAGGRRIRRAFWGEGYACDPVSAGLGFSLEDTLSVYLGEVYEQGIRYSADPNAILALSRREGYLKRYFGTESGAFITSPTEIRLDPVPAAAGTAVYFTYEGARYAAVGDVTDAIAELASAFLARARWYIHDTLSAGRGALTEASGPNVTSKNNAAVMHDKRAQVAMDEFVQNLPPALASYL